MATENIRILITSTGARRVVRDISSIGDRAARSATSVQTLQRVLLGVGTGIVLRQLFRFSDTFVEVENRLKLVTDSSQNLVEVQKELFQVANDTRSSFAATADLYSRVALSARNLGRTQREVIDFTKGLNQAIILSGATAQEARNGVIQFAQGLAANRLAGDELRAVLEQLPLVADVIAKQLGVTRGSLRDLAAQGKITAEQILDAFNPETLEELNRRFLETTPTISQAFTVLQNGIIEYIGALNQSQGPFIAFANSIIFVSDNFEKFADGVLGAAVVPALVLTISLVRSLTLALLANPLGALVAGLSVGIGVLAAFRNEITLTEGSLVTLEDVTVGLAEEFKFAFGEVLNSLSELTTGFSILDEAGNIELQDLLNSVATFADNFVGVFVGIGRVLEFVFDNPLQSLRALFVATINAIVDVLEFLSDSIVSIARGIGRTFDNLSSRLGLGISLIGEALTQLTAGNFEAADQFLSEATFQIAQGTKELAGNAVRNIKDEFATLRQEDVLPRLESSGARNTGEEIGQAFLEGFESTTGVRDLLGRALVRAEGRAAERELARLQAENQESTLNRPVPGTGFDGADDLATIAIREQIEALERQQALFRSGIGLTEQQIQVRAELFKIEEGFIRKGIEINDQQRQLIANAIEENIALQTQAEIFERLNGSRQNAQFQIQQLTALFDSGKISVEQYNNELRRLRLEELSGNRDVFSGFQRGLLNIQDTITNFGAQAETTLVNAFSSAEDALVQFVTTGEFNFSGLVDSILADLTRLVARQAIFGLLASFGGGGGFGSVGGLGGFLSGFGGARADGGPVRPDQSFLVGERGPEIFTPPSSGSIVSNEDATGRGSSPNVTVVNVMDPNEVTSVLSDPQNDQIFINMISRNSRRINNALGNR